MAKTRLAGLLMTWLLVILAAFYFFFWRFIQPFDHHQLYPDGQVDSAQLVEFIQSQIAPISSTSKQITVYHWLNPECRCTLISSLYIDKLSRKTNNENTRHIVLTPPNQAQALAEAFFDDDKVDVIALNEATYVQSRLLIPATPAAVVYYQKTQSLSYLGPHSSGVVCGKGTGFVELVLNNLEHGFDPALVELDQRGCFCDW